MKTQGYEIPRGERGWVGERIMVRGVRTAWWLRQRKLSPQRKLEAAANEMRHLRDKLREHFKK